MKACPHCGDKSLMPCCDCPKSIEERDAVKKRHQPIAPRCGDRIVDSVRAKLLTPDLGDTICEAVAEKLAQRSLIGQKKYGTKLTREDLSERDWLQHAQEEAMDLANYFEVLIQRTPLLTYHIEMQEQALAMACALEAEMQSL